MSLDKKCVVPGCCMIHSDPSVKWFPFPDQNSLTSIVKDKTTVYFSRRRLWMESLGITEHRLSKDAVVCPLHFKKQDIIVFEDGNVCLKNDAVPYPNLKAGVPQQQPEADGRQVHKHKENDIKIVENSDEDDDDVEIIEPHREIITLDDDDGEECQKDAKQTESNSVNSDINEEGELNSKDNDENPSTKTQEKDSNVPLTCMSPEAITHSIKDIINKEPNATTSEATSTSKDATILKENNVVKNENPSQDSTVEKPVLKEPENVNLLVKCVSKEGSKILVQIPKAGLSKTVSTLAVKGKAFKSPTLKIVSPPDMQKTKIPIETTKNVKLQFKQLNGQNLSTVEVSEAMKRQLSMLLKKNQTPPSKLIKIVNFPIGITPPLKTPEVPRKNLFKAANGNVAKVVQPVEISSPLKQRLLKPQNENQFSIPLVKRQSSSQVNKEQISNKNAEQGSGFKYVNVNEIIDHSNIKQEAMETVDENDVFQATREQGTQTEDDALIGFAEMYDFIQRNMVGFNFDVLGQNYRLKECALNFENELCGIRWDKKVAIVADSSLSSTDSLLLSGMNISIGLAKNYQSPDFRGYTKELGIKSERILKYMDEKKNNSLHPYIAMRNREYINQVEAYKALVDNKTTTATSGTTLNQNFSLDKRDQKIILHPNLVKLSRAKRTETEADMAKASIGSKLAKVNSESGVKTSKDPEELDKDRRKIIKKKKSPPKTSSARSRKLFRLPISQMNPSFRGKYTIDKNRPKKTKKPIQDSEKKKKPLENGESTETTESESKASTSAENDSIWENEEIGDSSEDKSPIKTRGATSLASTSAENDSIWENEEIGDSSEDKSPVKTRSATRCKKKDYRSLSTNGTTEDVKRSPLKRKKSSKKQTKIKKTKYSDKVGAIESFLEVVLEPENKEYHQNLSDSEKEKDADEDENKDNEKVAMD